MMLSCCDAKPGEVVRSGDGGVCFFHGITDSSKLKAKLTDR